LLNTLEECEESKFKLGFEGFYSLLSFNGNREIGFGDAVGGGDGAHGVRSIPRDGKAVVVKAEVEEEADLTEKVEEKSEEHPKTYTGQRHSGGNCRGHRGSYRHARDFKEASEVVVDEEAAEMEKSAEEPKEE
jgi:hypothetical protein